MGLSSGVVLHLMRSGFVPVVHDMAVTDVYIMPPLMSVEQSTAI